MKHVLDGASIHIATGGLDFDPANLCWCSSMEAARAI